MENRKDVVGRRYRRAANATTKASVWASRIVALNTVTGDRLLPKRFRHKSIGLGLGVAAIASLDKLDGYLGRKSAEYGVPITKEDKDLDSDADKEKTRLIMGSIAIRETIGGIHKRQPVRIAFAGALAVNMLWIHDRDRNMQNSRANAIEGADTGAIKINKIKTGLQNLGHTMSASPLAANPIGMATITGVYTLSSYIGQRGYEIADRIHRGEGLVATHLAEVIDLDSARAAATNPAD